MDAADNRLANEYEIFTQLDKPKYIIAGKQDPSVNFNYLKQVKENSIGICELIVFENCGHYPSLEKPEEFIIKLKNITDSVFG